MIIMKSIKGTKLILTTHPTELAHAIPKIKLIILVTDR